MLKAWLWQAAAQQCFNRSYKMLSALSALKQPILVDVVLPHSNKKSGVWRMCCRQQLCKLQLQLAQALTAGYVPSQICLQGSQKITQPCTAKIALTCWLPH